MNLFSVASKKGKWEEVFSRLIDEVRNYQTDEYGEDFVAKGKR